MSLPLKRPLVLLGAIALMIGVASPGAAVDGRTALANDVVIADAAVPPPIQQDIPSLYEAEQGKFLIGAAMKTWQIDQPVEPLLAKHFNSVTPEYEMKWGNVQPQEGLWTFGAGDRIVDWANENDAVVRGHALIWHQSTPAWVFLNPVSGQPLTDSPEDQQILLDRMESHITTVMQHYADDIKIWDVVNEAVDEKQADNLRHSRWYDVLGPDYIKYAFEFARAAVPDAKLYYNDYETEFAFKSGPVFDLLKGLIVGGAPIDGIGHQMHLTMFSPSMAEVDASLDLFATLGIDQAVTELDVGVSTRDLALTSVSDELLAEQGHYFSELFEVFNDHADELISVTGWGIYDGQTWLSTWPMNRAEAPLFFDKDMQAKPAYWAVVDPTQLPTWPRISVADQCKDGGWKNFVQKFGNQGECVSAKVSGS